MANKANSLAHTKWMCKYHIVFTPKYKRKIIYNQYKDKFENRHFWAEGYYVSTVGLNEATIKNTFRNKKNMI